ncbi:MAG: peptide chain release factor 2 [Oscillospiraceae bacterium]|jgi:peptide chain release factor 2|nr:peptide chain release factor 2 [Oscillospiraceae bacterium]
MFQADELNFYLSEILLEIKDLALALGLEKAKQQIIKLERISSEKEFWEESQETQKTFKTLSYLKVKIENYEKLIGNFEDLSTLVKLILEDEDSSLLKEANEGFLNLKKELEHQKLKTLLNGEFDSRNAILTLHAGAGGTEAQDWVEMLYRMYCKYCQKQEYKIKMLDFLDGEEVGLKSISFLVEGLNAYGYLKGESGVHRLVRISPFDSSGRRHTSFASLEVIPELDDYSKVEISPNDLKMDVFRSSGAGGQHVNKTSSAVRLTHLPSGIVACCQNERSQYQNREIALKMIKSKLMEIKEREHLKRVEDIKGKQKEIAWGSQIRSYTFMPYTLVKDHITGFETGNINAVMNGEIEGFVNAQLKRMSQKKS